MREQAPFVWNTVPQGFWMLSRYDQVRDALQRPDVFTSPGATEHRFPLVLVSPVRRTAGS